MKESIPLGVKVLVATYEDYHVILNNFKWQLTVSMETNTVWL